MKLEPVNPTFKNRTELLKSYPRLSEEFFYSWDGKNTNKGFITKIISGGHPLYANVVQTDGRKKGDCHTFPILYLCSSKELAIKNKIK